MVEFTFQLLISLRFKIHKSKIKPKGQNKELFSKIVKDLNISLCELNSIKVRQVDDYYIIYLILLFPSLPHPNGSRIDLIHNNEIVKTGYINTKETIWS